MTNTLTHSCETHTAALSSYRGQLCVWYAGTFVLDLQEYVLGITRNVNRRGLTARMAVNIRQAFLYDSKNR